MTLYVRLQNYGVINFVPFLDHPVVLLFKRLKFMTIKIGIQGRGLRSYRRTAVIYVGTGSVLQLHE